MSKKKRRPGEADALIRQLAAQFPKCFALDERRHRPLALRIDTTIVRVLAITPKALRNALAAYTHSTGYLRATVAGAVRIDIDGNPAGTVTVAEADHARELLTKRMARLTAPSESKQQPAVAPPKPALAPIAVNGPKRLGLADLRTAGRARRGAPLMAPSRHAPRDSFDIDAALLGRSELPK